MEKILVVAPHPDDETLGCGGTLLRHRAEGAEVHWLLVTDEADPARRAASPRRREVEAAARHYGFAGVHALELPEIQLDALPLSDIVAKIGAVVRTVEPETLYLPFPGDAHSDHAATFSACVSCTKSFRYPFVRRIRVYETLSETEFGISPITRPFQPNLFVDISEHLEGKIAAMSLFASQIKPFPFPRSLEAVRAQAMLRGATVGRMAAEAFMTLRETI